MDDILHDWFIIDVELIPRSPYRLITPDERERLHLARINGEKKPQDISYGDWMGPKSLKPRHRLYCIAAAGGFLNRNIARHYGLTESRLSIILSASSCRNLIGEIRTRFNDTELFMKCLKLGFKPEDRWWSEGK